MNELTLKFDYWLDKELEYYISSLKGVYECKINDKENSIYIKYDSNQISIKILNYEILAFLNLLNAPSIIAFDKGVNYSSNYTIKISNLCCEYCLMSMIEELFIINGIGKANTNFDCRNFDYHDKENVLINIAYDSHKITIDEIKKLEEKFNN